MEDEQAMHMLIRVLTLGRSPDDALGRARGTLDHLVGIGKYATPVFDYYRTMNDTAARFRDHPTYGQLDPVLSLESETGKQILEEAVDAQERWFVDTLAELREKLDTLDPTEVMTDVDLARFDCYRVGQFAGPSVWVYDEHGAGLRSRSAVDEYVECHDDDDLWIVPADVHY